jgi:hypothetical protein
MSPYLIIFLCGQVDNPDFFLWILDEAFPLVKLYHESNTLECLVQLALPVISILDGHAILEAFLFP